MDAYGCMQMIDRMHLDDTGCNTYHVLPVDDILLAHAHDMSQGMGQVMLMTWDKTWALLKAALNAAQ